MKIGNTEITGVYKGSTPITSLYKGDTLYWGKKDINPNLQFLVKPVNSRVVLPISGWYNRTSQVTSSIEIDWGDGETSSFTTRVSSAQWNIHFPNHNYTDTNKDYIVTVTSNRPFGAISYASPGNTVSATSAMQQSLISILNWGTTDIYGVYLPTTCTNLTSVAKDPVGVLKIQDSGLVEVYNSLQGALESIDLSLFKNVTSTEMVRLGNPALTTVTGVFPEDGSKQFVETFYQATSLQSVPYNIFPKSANVFIRCFQYSGLTETAKDNIDGVVSELWERVGKEGYPSRINAASCYDHTNIPDLQSSVPSDWR